MGRRKKNSNIIVRKNPMRSVKKQKQQIASFNISNASERCKQWLLEQKKMKKEEPLEDINEIGFAEESPKPSLKLKIKRHQWKKMQNFVDFTCEWRKCNFEVGNKQEFCDHVFRHSTNIVPNEDLYECLWDLCGFVTTDPFALSRHVSYHSYHTTLKTYGDSYRQCASFPQCSFDSRNRNFFNDMERDYICQWRNCKKNFNSIIDFFNHVNSEHCTSLFKKDVTQCKWENCGKLFDTNSNLKFHIGVHTREKNVACPHCGSSFRNVIDFYDHCRRQVTNQEYQCDQCYKYFSAERILRIHMRGHLNSFKCTLCDMTCSSPYQLARHMRYRHISEKPFSCKYCHFRAVTKKDIQVHTTTHFEEVYECQELECNFKCKSNYLLKKHDMVVHGNGLNCYACHCCDKRYHYSTILSRHLKRVHKFQYPSGHNRFTYKPCPDGMYRLQTMRVESWEVTKQIIFTNEELQNRIVEIDHLEKTKQLSDNTLLLMSMTVKEENVMPEECSGTTVNKISNIEIKSEPRSEISETDNQANCIGKNIDDFKIMKYLKQ